jgi:hypothetical protein
MIRSVHEDGNLLTFDGNAVETLSSIVAKYVGWLDEALRVKAQLMQTAVDQQKGRGGPRKPAHSAPPIEAEYATLLRRRMPTKAAVVVKERHRHVESRLLMQYAIAADALSKVESRERLILYDQQHASLSSIRVASLFPSAQEDIEVQADRAQRRKTWRSMNCRYVPPCQRGIPASIGVLPWASGDIYALS